MWAVEYEAELEEKVESQTVKMKRQLFWLSAIQDDSAKVAFYTGSSSYTCLQAFFQFLGPAVSCLIYCMGTNFQGWLNFAVFKGTSQTAKNNIGEIFVRLCPRKNTRRCWARQAREWLSFVTFVQPLTTEEKLCLLFSFAITCSLIHEYHCPTNPKRAW